MAVLVAVAIGVVVYTLLEVWALFGRGDTLSDKDRCAAYRRLRDGE